MTTTAAEIIARQREWYATEGANLERAIGAWRDSVLRAAFDRMMILVNCETALDEIRAMADAARVSHGIAPLGPRR